MELQSKVNNYSIMSVQPQCCLLYLVVVEIVHEDLHDAREEKHTGAGDEEVVDVVK